MAQHSVLVSLAVSPELALPGLIHDSAEYVVSDVPSPMKKMLFFVLGNKTVPFKDVEEEILQTIFAALDIEWPSRSDWAEIKKADESLLATEARDLMAPLHPDWWMQEKNGYKVLPDEIVPWSAGRSRWEFMERYEKLRAAE